MKPFSTKKWKVVYSRGEGETYVFADTELDAKLEALAFYRKKKAFVDFVKIDDLIADIAFVD